MKNIVLSSVVTALLMFSGCTDKDPVVDNTTKNETVKEVAPVVIEKVSDENAQVNSNTNSRAELEKRLGSIYFAFDEYKISTEMQTSVSSDATVAKEAASAFNIKVEGNCDERGSDEYNFALGLQRAGSVKEALVAHGVDANKINLVSHGETNPTCTDKTQECWAKNRRVDFSLLP